MLLTTPAVLGEEWCTIMMLVILSEFDWGQTQRFVAKDSAELGIGGLCRVSTHQRSSSPQDCESHSLCAFGEIKKSSSANVNVTSDEVGLLRNDSSHGM